MREESSRRMERTPRPFVVYVRSPQWHLFFQYRASFSDYLPRTWYLSYSTRISKFEMATRRNEPIAIIRTSYRFSRGSKSPSRLWGLLRQPREVATHIDRFGLDGFCHPGGSHQGTTNVEELYLLEENIWRFDAHLFNIQPAGVESIDPQR